MNIRKFFSTYAILLVLILLILIFSISRPAAFLNVSNLFNIVRQVSMLGITAVGMTFVMLTGGFDLSVGTMQGLIGTFAAAFMVNLGMHPVVAVILTLAVAMIVGIFNGVVITRLGVNPFICTLSSMTIIKGIAFTFTGGLPIYGFTPSFQVLGQGYIANVIPIPVVIMLGIFIFGIYLLNNTYLGRYLYSVGGNEEASRLSGINVKKVKMIAYVLCSFLAGVAGIILLSRLNSGQPNAGSGFEFDVITAVVLGGVSLKGGEGKLSGVLLGVLIMGVLSNGMIIMNVNEFYQWIIKGFVLIAAVTMDGLSYSPNKEEGIINKGNTASIKQ